jgi:hypothetical protein
MRRGAADWKEQIPAMMKKHLQRQRHQDSSVTPRYAEMEIAADPAQRVAARSPFVPSHAPWYAMKGVMHSQVEVLVDNEFESVRQVIFPPF